MGGQEAGQPPSTPPSPDDALATALVEVAHWRSLALEREAAMRALTRRPLVRIAIGVHRRLAPLQHRAARWSGWLKAPIERATLVASSLPGRAARRRRRAALREQIRTLPAPGAGRPVTVVVTSGWIDDAWRDAAGCPVTEVVVAAGTSPSTALTAAASASETDVVCFLPAPVRAVAPGWLAQLVAVVGRDGVVAATPTLVHPARRGLRATRDDLLVRSAGWDLTLEAGTPVVTPRHAGRAVDGRAHPAEVAAAPLHGLAVDRRAFLAAGGLQARDDGPDVAAVDLCARLRARGGRVLHVAGSMVYDERPVGSERDLRRAIAPDDEHWRALVEREGPAILRTCVLGPDAPLRWTITTAAPSARMAERWGDTHLAEGLARALRRQGHDVRVSPCDAADSLATRATDVHLVLRGLAPVRRTSGQHHILWVISHPEAVEVAECDDADLVLVASPRFAAALRSRTSTPVEVVLQATDPDRFHPCPVDPAHRHPVTIVAKTRDVRRAVVTDALAAGLRPAIYGSGWRALVDPSLVVADHVDNAELPVVYSSAGVVLNDHWGTMRSWGFVSNRIFDVLACGTPVISDELAEIHDLLGDAVPTYRSPAELGALVHDALADPDAARERAAVGRAAVLAHHTFDHRATQLLDLMRQHSLDRPPELARP